MAEEVRRKLAEVQARLAEQSIYLRDLETRLSEVEEAVGVLVIPRIGRSSPRRSSPHEYIVEVSPAYGEPTTITLTALSDKQAIEKAKEEARYPIPATAKILSKVEVESSSNPSRWVLELYPLDVLAWRSSLIELSGKPLTPSEYRLVNDYNNYLSRRGYLTSRQIEVLGEIARRHDVALPAIPERVT